MKKTILITGLAVTSMLTSCNKNKVDPEETPKENKVLLLKINYMTYAFEGGQELIFSERISTSDSLPITTNYKSPGDFGSISLFYQSKNDTLFHGTVHWMGSGEIYYPRQFESIDKFSLLGTPIATPDRSKFQIINYSNELWFKEILATADYSRIWSSISKLKVVSDYLKSNKKIGLLLYPPYVGTGETLSTWNWIIMLNN